MSLESWKKEYYPTPAWEVKDVDEALAHTERKWCGLRRANLERYGCRRLDGKHSIVDKGWVDGDPTFLVTTATCTLCSLFYGVGKRHADCPIASATNYCTGESSQPFGVFSDTDDPEPMLEAIRTAIRKRKVEEEQKQMDKIIEWGKKFGEAAVEAARKLGAEELKKGRVEQEKKMLGPSYHDLYVENKELKGRAERLADVVADQDRRIENLRNDSAALRVELEGARKDMGDYREAWVKRGEDNAQLIKQRNEFERQANDRTIEISKL